MIDVLFGQAYYLRFDAKQWKAQQPYPPLGTLYAAAVARQHGFEVDLFDAMIAGSEQQWDQALDRARPRLAILFEDSFNYLSKMCLLRMREAAAVMIAQASRRGVPVIVASSDASDHPDVYLAAGAHAVIVGEGEQTMVELLNAMLKRETGGNRGAQLDAPLDAINGLAYHGPDGQVVRTAPRAILKDLDALPFPAWDLVDVDRYRHIWRGHHGYHSMNLVTTRGCPYHCNWCAKPIYGQRYSVRSPENVAAELEWLRDTYAPDHIWFADDIFGLRPDWIERYSELVRDQRTVTPFKCQLRVDLVNERVADALKRAACRTVWVGAESGSQKILDAMEKGTRVDQIYRAASLLKAAGIEVAFFLQFGYPGEAWDDIEKTLQMVRDCRPDDIGISVSYPLPGTRFYDHVQSQLGSKRQWSDSNDLAMMYNGPFSTAFYRQLHRRVHTEFRLRRERDAVVNGGANARAGRRGALLHRAVSLARCGYYAAALPVARARLRRMAQSAAGVQRLLPPPPSLDATVPSEPGD